VRCCELATREAHQLGCNYKQLGKGCTSTAEAEKVPTEYLLLVEDGKALFFLEMVPTCTAGTVITAGRQQGYIRAAYLLSFLATSQRVKRRLFSFGDASHH
jgi:hypothetical protein